MQPFHLQHFLFASLPVYTTIDTIGFWTVLGKFVEFEIDVSTGLPLNYLSHFFQHIQKNVAKKSKMATILRKILTGFHLENVKISSFPKTINLIDEPKLYINYHLS
jgi:hypothetical protein